MTADAPPGNAELPWPATCDGVAEGEAVSWKRSLQLGIAMAGPGNAELQLGILGWPPEPHRGHLTPVTRTALPRADNSKLRIEN